MLAEVGAIIGGILLVAYMFTSAIHHEIEKEIKAEKAAMSEVAK